MHHVNIVVKCEIWNETDIHNATRAIDQIMEQGQQENFLSPHLMEVIVSDKYVDEWIAIAGRWNLHSVLSKEAEYISGGKLCFNKDTHHPKYIILFHPSVFSDADYADHFYRFMLSIVAQDHLPNELKLEHEYRFETPVPELAKVFFSGFFDAFYANIRLKIEGRENMAPPIAPKNLLASFKRKVKRLHWQHQADLDFEACVMGYYAILLRLLTQVVDTSFYQVDYVEFDDFETVIRDFLSGIYAEAFKIIKGEPYSLQFLEQTIVECSKLCFFTITLTPHNIHVSDTPKRLFNDLVDTHQRIVAFVDVLGFSEMIKKVDRYNNIIILKDLKSALDGAIEQMLKISTPSDEEVEIKLFSDCLCLSAAYFDNDTDLAYQFSRLMLGLKTYQFLMLQKGYLVRGGVAIGSYYSDPNMIFSGALVEAVGFEKNCHTRPDGSTKSKKRSPRILISPKIVEKLEQSTIHKVMTHYYNNSLLVDKEDDEIFVNPLFDLTSSQFVYDIAFDQLEPLKTISPELYETAKKNIQNLKSTLSDGAGQSIFNEITRQLDLQIEQEQSNAGVVAKYEWTKSFIDWIRTGMVHHPFVVRQVVFRNVGHW